MTSTRGAVHVGRRSYLNSKFLVGVLREKAQSRLIENSDAHRESTLPATLQLWSPLLITPQSLKPTSFIKIMKPLSHPTMAITPP